MKIGKVEKLVANLYDKTEYAIHIRNIKQALTEYAIHIRNIKQALNHGLVLKKFIQWLNLIKIFLEKPWKMWENIEILNLSQHKEEEII